MSEHDVQRIIEQIRELPKHEQSLIRHRMDEPDFSIKTYPCGETYAGGRRWRHERFIRTGEMRCPKRGEWYLSGAIPMAYMAPNELGIIYHIVKEVK